MTKYILNDWEVNGYNDSDFCCAYYDDVTDTLDYTCYGTTRFQSGHCISFQDNVSTVEVQGEYLLAPTKEIVEKARLALAAHIYKRIVKAEERDVLELMLGSLKEGIRVRVIKEAKFQVKSQLTCLKCNGTGNWVNPKLSVDVRECFACHGEGFQVGEKKKDAKGKPIWEKIPVGVSGVVVDVKSFRQFFANGYNQPDRTNTRVLFRTDEGKQYRVTLDKLRLDREMDSEAELKFRANQLSFRLQFGVVAPKHTWDSRNFAAEVLKAG